MPPAQVFAWTVLNTARSIGSNRSSPFERQRRVQQRGLTSDVNLWLCLKWSVQRSLLHSHGAVYTGPGESREGISGVLASSQLRWNVRSVLRPSPQRQLKLGFRGSSATAQVHPMWRGRCCRRSARQKSSLCCNVCHRQRAKLQHPALSLQSKSDLLPKVF